MERVLDYVDRNMERFVEEVVALSRIPSISAQGVGLEDYARIFARMLEEVGLRAEILPMGGPQNPPLVYGRFDKPGAKRTLFLYGHLDVQPPEPLEDWESPPFQPEVRGGRLYGRGTSDNKGQLVAHLKAIEALRSAGGGIPLNLRILIDPQEEIGSPMLASFVEAHADLFRADFAYGADAGAAEGDRPMLSFGSRGACYLEVKVRTARGDVHSGTNGGPMPNAAWRLVEFLQTLREPDGRVVIEGFYDQVLPPTEAERAAMDAIPFDPEAWRREMGIAGEAGPPGLGHFEKIMFQPAMNICGFHGGYTGPGTKTVIPCEASAKIDIRLVKSQSPPEILEKFARHARARGFPDLEIVPHPFQYHPSRTPVDHPMGGAVAAAVAEAFGVEPLLYPATGGSSPSYIFRDRLGMPMIRVPYATCDESSHAPNENLSLDFFRKGIETTARVMRALASL